MVFTYFLQNASISIHQLISNVVLNLTHSRCLQKQLFTDVLQNKCSQNLVKFHRKTPVLETLFNKVPGLRLVTLFKKRLQHRCLPVKFKQFSRTLFFTEHLQWLLLDLARLSRTYQKGSKNIQAGKRIYV